MTCVFVGVACGSKSSLFAERGILDGGAEGATTSRTGAGGDGAHADAFVNAAVAPGPGGLICSFNALTSFVTIGQTRSDLCSMTTVRDGDSQNGDAVRVACSVAPSGNGFDVSLTASVAGSAAGTFALRVHVSQSDAGFVQPSQPTASFESARYGTYVPVNLIGGLGCTVTAYLPLTTSGCPAPAGPPVAPGRIWGHLSCLDVQPTGQTSYTNGCDGEADFFFENCAQ